MNKNIFNSIALGAILLGLGGCADTWEPGISTNGHGTLNMEQMSVDVSEIEKVINVDAAGSRAEYASYNLGDFTVKVTNTDNGAVANTWTYAATPELATFEPGNYKLEIYSHEVQPAEWERPYFYVAENFSIKKDEITRVGTLTAKLQNSAVSVRFDESLMKYIEKDNDVKVVVKANHAGELSYTTDELRKGYFQIVDNSTTLTVAFTGTINGYPEEFHLPAVDLAAGQHRIYTFKAKVNNNEVPDETGNLNPGSGIIIDTSVTEEDVDGNVTLDEDAENVAPEDRPGYEQPDTPSEPDDPNTPDTPDDPSEDVATFTPSDGLSLTDVNNYLDFGEEDGKKECSVIIDCPASIQNLKVEINSVYLTDEFLESVQLGTKFDLTEPGQYRAGLVDLEFPIENDVRGKTQVKFNITKLVPLLNVGVLTGACSESDLHTFIINVIDKNGKTASLTLRFNGLGN